jgi:hypothetical protein
MICPNCKGQTEEEGVDCFVCRALVEPTPKPTEEGPYTDNGMSPSAFKYKVLGPGVDEEMFHLQMETTNSTKLPVFLLNFGFSQGAASRDEEISGMKERAMMDKAEIQNLKAEVKQLKDAHMKLYKRSELTSETNELLEARFKALRKWLEMDPACPVRGTPLVIILNKLTELSGGE